MFSIYLLLIVSVRLLLFEGELKGDGLCTVYLFDSIERVTMLSTAIIGASTCFFFFLRKKRGDCNLRMIRVCAVCMCGHSVYFVDISSTACVRAGNVAVFYYCTYLWLGPWFFGMCVYVCVSWKDGGDFVLALRIRFLTTTCIWLSSIP